MDLSWILVSSVVHSIGEQKYYSVLEVQGSFGVQIIVLPFAINAKKIG